MASDGADTQDLSDATHEPRECMACRGSPSTVECPWCGGGGLRPAEADAQAHWGEQGADGSPEGDESSAQAAEPTGSASG